MLTDDEPSLEYLRTGMKNLLALLSEEFDVSGCDSVSIPKGNVDCIESSIGENLPAWPEPRPFERLFAERRYFVAICDPSVSPPETVSQRRLLTARRRHHCATDLVNPTTACLVVSS